ncbi:hypothetical protein BN85403230 [Alteracholeplasma palmae J233]|uniref:Uncharacterized protein n=1 Tax=Alteracholeplasma palmae (strain ATCC 49389 / J233) TaxID=1318466 RepID=U4KNW2_ALTPJ|nr:hypothetical protein BN85403230 [Alteracholeplasma palmae J233]
MNYLYITCEDSNHASSRITLKLGSKLIEEVVPPKAYIFYYDQMGKYKI